MNVLIILGHPRTDSLCGALADAYGKAPAKQAPRCAGWIWRRSISTPTFTPFPQ
jgi:hypothetical protein